VDNPFQSTSCLSLGGEIWTCGERWPCPCFSHTRNNNCDFSHFPSVIKNTLCPYLWVWVITFFAIKQVSEPTRFDSENRGIMFFHSVSACLWFHMITQCRRLVLGVLSLATILFP
jgi:hypothetical protein